MMQTLTATQAVLERGRISSIDMLRGLVMLIMLLDHVRERVLLHLQVSDPMDINTTEPGLFFSRLLAHWCAPVFIFLTGVSAYLYQQKGRALTPFLLKRGLVLILLEMTLVNVAWLGTYHTLYLQVIWVIGLCMVLLALLHHLPRPLLLVLGCLLVAGHNLLTPVQFAPGEAGYWLWTILHDRGFLLAPGEAAIAVKISYPLLPWVGVIVLGYLAGSWYQLPAGQRQRILWRSGWLALAVLLLLRGFNLYGETQDWQWQPTLLSTVMDLLNFTKYPPSLDFLLLTLGLMCLALLGFERAAATRSDARWQQVLTDFGAAPMFFYILHLYALLLLYNLALLLFEPNQMTAYGMMLGVSHIGWVWLLAVLLAVALHRPTRWFAGFKQRSHWRWVRYF
jgi:uncharacterized membrane protein